MVQSNVMVATHQPEPILPSNHLRPGEVELADVPDGGWFKMAETQVDGKHVTVVGWIYGQKEFHNDCRARVHLPGTNSKHVVFGEGSARRVFNASGAVSVNWPIMVGVVAITAEEYERITQPASFRQPHEGENTGEIMDAKIIKAHVAKYKFQLSALEKATAANDEAGLAIAQGRLTAVKEGAEAAGVDVVAEYKAAQGKEAPATTNPPAKPTLVKGAATAKAPKLTRLEKDAALETKRAAAKAAKPAKAPREKKLQTMNTCLCGCNSECGGTFAPGHDARVKGMLYKVERGELPYADLPEILKPHVKFAGRAATAGKDTSDYRIVQAPVKFPGRDDIKVIKPAA